MVHKTWYIYYNPEIYGEWLSKETFSKNFQPVVFFVHNKHTEDLSNM